MKMENAHCWRQTAYNAAAPLILVAVSLALAPWLYNFPLNDDWAYAIGVQNLLRHGRVILCDWPAAAQLPHLLSGAIFAKLFGFSFTVLKAYTLAAAAGTVFIFVKLLEEFDVPPINRLLAALVLALNPLSLLLTVSFMTEMTYLFWTILASYLYVRHLRAGARPPGAADKPRFMDHDDYLLLGAGFCAALACLTRQLGAALPLAHTLILARQKRFSLRSLLIGWLFPLAAIAGYALWFKYVHGPTWASENYVMASTLKYLADPAAYAANTFHRLFDLMIETGIFLFPLAAGYYQLVFRSRVKSAAPASSSRTGRPARVVEQPRWFFWGLLAALAGFALMNGPLPYLQNSLSWTGLGVPTLEGAELKNSGFFSNRYFWYVLTAAAVFSAATLLELSRSSLKAGDAAVRFMFAAAAAQLGITLISHTLFDRYLLVIFPWFIFAAVLAAAADESAALPAAKQARSRTDKPAGTARFSRVAAVSALVLMAAGSWAGVKDYLQWNRAKWELALKPRPGVPPQEIANGFDYNGWFSYEKNMAYLKARKPLKLIGYWEWQDIAPCKAVAKFSEDPAYTTIDRQEYSTPLSSRPEFIYLLKRR